MTFSSLNYVALSCIVCWIMCIGMPRSRGWSTILWRPWYNGSHHGLRIFTIKEHEYCVLCVCYTGNYFREAKTVCGQKIHDGVGGC